MASTRNSSSRKTRPDFICSECGWTTSKWVGRCGECQTWDSVRERGASTQAGLTAPAAIATTAVPIADVPADQTPRFSTKVGEFDRVLGGGVVMGSVILVAGEPGVGKSTMLLHAAAAASTDRRVLYVTGEESAAQVRLRAERIGALAPNLYLAAESDLGAVLTHIDQVKPALVVADSVQTFVSAHLDSAAGNVAQVREVAAALINVAKTRNVAMMLVGHVTKEGAIAGPRTLEHLVDVVCHFEGDRHAALRIVRSVKNRYGATDEVGCFELADDGIREIADPSSLFLSQRTAPAPGSCVTVMVEGRRPLLVEVQALATWASGNNAKRSTSGLDSARVAMTSAVLANRANLPMHKLDTFAATVAGVKVTEPAADLAVAIALASAIGGVNIDPSLVAIGEVGLSGEIRNVASLDQRVHEAIRCGYTTIVVPGTYQPTEVPSGVILHRVDDLRHALQVTTGKVRAPQESLSQANGTNGQRISNPRVRRGRASRLPSNVRVLPQRSNRAR